PLSMLPPPRRVIRVQSEADGQSHPPRSRKIVDDPRSDFPAIGGRAGVPRTRRTHGAPCLSWVVASHSGGVHSHDPMDDIAAGGYSGPVVSNSNGSCLNG